MPSHAETALTHLGLAHEHAAKADPHELEAIAIGCSATAAAFLGAFLGRSSAIPPSRSEAMMQLLMEIKDLCTMTDANLDAIAQDWPALKAALQTRLTTDADTIAKLTAELAASATSSTPMSDARAAQIDADMQATIASLNGAASAVGGAGGPTAGATSLTADPASIGAQGSSVAQPPTPAAGATAAASPAAAPPGAL